MECINIKMVVLRGCLAFISGFVTRWKGTEMAFSLSEVHGEYGRQPCVEIMWKNEAFIVKAMHFSWHHKTSIIIPTIQRKVFKNVEEKRKQIEVNVKYEYLDRLLGGRDKENEISYSKMTWLTLNREMDGMLKRLTLHHNAWPSRRKLRSPYSVFTADDNNRQI